MTNDPLVRASQRLKALEAHHPTMVLYSEAKWLYKTIPFLISLLDTAASDGAAIADIRAELVGLAEVLLEEKND